MEQQNFYPVRLNSWFEENELVTDLGIVGTTAIPQLENGWEILGIEKSYTNLPKLIKKSMEFCLLDDRTLNFLFPDLGCVVFRLFVENIISGCNTTRDGNELILNAEKSLENFNPEEPFIFYTPVSPVRLEAIPGF